jgi:hypothetical protein
MEKYDMTHIDVVCFLIFQTYFSMEKYGMTWDDVIYLYIERIKINDL